MSNDLNGGYRHPFMFGAHYLGGLGDNPRTLSDLAMSQLSAELRRKDKWWINFRDEPTKRSWRGAARERIWEVRTPSATAQVKLSHKQIDYVLDELSGYAALRDERNNCQVSCFERIWESDSIVDESMREQLINELDKLSPTPLKDPSDTTIDLIDPMLYCLVYGSTLVSRLDGHLQPVPPPPNNNSYTVSTRFSLLPSDVYVSHDGSARFLSYINNLHPRHRSLYILLESCLTKLLPLFEHTLTDLHRSNPLLQRIQGTCRYDVWDEPDPPQYSDDEEGWSVYEREMRHWVLNRPIQLPEVNDTGYAGGLEHRRYIVSLREKRLQLIVRITNTHITRENPNFPGSDWHVEGMRNERIVACGLYCLSAENVSPSQVKFRMAVTYPRGFPAGDTGGTLRTWGIQDRDSCHQYIGSVTLRTGLGLVFPNIYQHRQTTYSLVDPEKPGHCTMIYFYLRDPDIPPRISTAVVGPQQKKWIQEAVSESLSSHLPIELIEKIIEDVEGLIDEKTAIDNKKEMSQILENFRRANNNYHFCLPFDIWQV